MWPIYRCPLRELTMVDRSICSHGLHSRTWSCRQLGHCRGRISWYTSQWVAETGCNHIRGGYGSVNGWGNSQILVLEAGTNFLNVFNMSATIAKEGGREQLEQSDMPLALNTAIMAKAGFSRAAIQETQYLDKRPSMEFWDGKKRGDVFPGHKQVEAAMD